MGSADTRRDRWTRWPQARGARRLALFLVALLLGAPAAHADRDQLVEGRKLSRSKDLAERLQGVRLLAESDDPGAVQPLEDAIRACSRDMDRLAKDLDKLDEDYTEAAGYWSQARVSNSAEFYDLAKRYYELVQRAWQAKAVDLILALEIMKTAGESFSRFRDPAAVAAITRGARTESSPLVRQWYIRALGALGDDEAIEALIALLDHADPLTRAASVRALQPAVLRRSVYDALVRAAGDDLWQVRVGAWNGLARAPLDMAVPPLVAAAAREDGDMAQRVDALLGSLLGVRFTDNPAEWERFWKENEEAVRDGTYKPPTRSSGRAHTVETFFSLPLDSTNVLFLVDLSSSMEEELELDDARNREVRDELGLPATRLGVVQAEVARALRGLPDGALFQIVVYSDAAERFRSGPTKVNDASRRSAISWLLRQKSGWLTNIWAGLHEAFDDALGSGAAAGRFKKLPDTIVFLTDGTPTRGRFQSTRSLLRLVELWNLSVDAVLLTVGVGEDHDEELLRGCATRSGGLYMDLRRRGRAPPLVRPGVPEAERVPPTTQWLAKARAELDEWNATDDRLAAVKRLPDLLEWVPEALRLLLDQLDAGQPEVRDAAGAVIATLGPAWRPRVVQALGRHLEDGLEGIGRGTDAALRVLAAYGEDAAPAVDAIARLVACERSAHRLEAAAALGALGAPAQAARPTLEAARASADGELADAIDAALERIK
ncbi:MAG: HEAT repeat domain-containing protein [Planctomycetota bacterium]